MVNPHLAHTHTHTHHRINGDSLSPLDQLMRIQLEPQSVNPRVPLDGRYCAEHEISRSFPDGTSICGHIQ